MPIQLRDSNGNLVAMTNAQKLQFVQEIGALSSVPAATATTVGGVKPGNGLSISPDGSISVTLTGISIDIAGTAAVGQTLSAVLPPGWSASTWQWYRVDSNDVYTAIAGATTSTYTITSADQDYGLVPAASGFVFTSRKKADVPPAAFTVPTIATPPTFVTLVVGQPLIFNAASGITGNPTPSVVYDLMQGTTVVASNITSGSFTPTTAGVSYSIRATATNTAGVVSSSSAVVTVSASASAYDIIAVAGQSNTVGTNSTINLANDPDPGTYDLTVDPNVKIWGTTGNDAAAFHSINGYMSGSSLKVSTAQANITVTSPAYLLARLYAAQTGRKVLLVHTGYSATSLYNGPWQPTATISNPTYAASGLVSTAASNLFLNLIYETNLALNAAQVAAPGSRVVGLAFIQGENDAGTLVTTPNYKNSLTGLVNGFRSNVSGASTAWFVCGGMLPEGIYTEGMDSAIPGWNVGARSIHRAHKLTANALPYSSFARGSYGGADRSADAAFTTGAVHYRSRATKLDLAQRMLAAVTSAQARPLGGEMPTRPATPTIQTAIATSGQSVRLQLNRDFSNGNTDLVIRYKLSSSQTWTTYYNLGVGTYQYAETIWVGGLTASQQYDFQVADMNAAGTSDYSPTVSATTSSTLAGYTFQDDTVGSTANGISTKSRQSQVAAAPAVTTVGGMPAYGKSLNGGSGSGTTWDYHLDKIPVSTDRTITFRLGNLGSATGVAIAVVMRAQPDCVSVNGFTGVYSGYHVTVPASANGKVTICGDATTDITTSTKYLGTKTDGLYRISCTGTSVVTIALDYSADNGATWTNYLTGVDNNGTYQAGDVQFCIYSTATIANLYVGSINWS